MSAVVRDYRRGDEGRIALLRPDMADAFEALGRKIHDGVRFTLDDGGEVLAVGGASLDENTDSFDLWLLCSDLRPRHWLQVFAGAKKLIADIKATGNERIWVHAAKDCRGAAAFVLKLGFQPSGKREVFYV